MTDPHTARDERILAAATVLAHGTGLAALTREAIAASAGMANSSVSNFERTAATMTARLGPVMPRIVSAVLHAAVDAGDLALVAQGLGLQHPVALAAPHALRVAALTAVGGAD